MTQLGTLALSTAAQQIEPAPPSDEATEQLQSEQFPTQSVINSVPPLCPTLSTGVLYTLDGTTANTSLCYHFEITARSKTTLLVVAQNAATDIDLSLIRHNSDDSLTTLGQSATSGNADEAVLAFTEPGHYYWFMQINQSDGGPFSFGAAVNTQVDQYEPNDSIETAIQLPDRQNKIQGNIDNPDDVDYFSFKAVRGQDTLLRLDDAASSNAWILEIYNAGWQEMSNNADITLHNLSANQQIYVRIRARSGLNIDAVKNYRLTFGSKVTQLGSHNVAGETNVLRIPYAATGFSLTTQAYRQLFWSASLLDSKGHPVTGAEAELVLDKNLLDQDHAQIYPATSAANGIASGTVNLGTCYSASSVDHIDYSMGYKNTWRSEFNQGAWILRVKHSTAGVGGAVTVSLAHLCSQRLLSSVPS